MASAAQYDKLHLFIDGEWLGAVRAQDRRRHQPGDRRDDRRLPHASKADLDRALDAAQRGFLAWRKVSPNERAKVLRKAGELFRERADHIATQMTLEEGKTLGESSSRCSARPRSSNGWPRNAAAPTAAWCRRARRPRQMVLREPVGPVAAFSPWNFPAVTPARKDRRLARRGLLVHHQAGRGDAGDGARHGQVPRGCRAAQGRARGRLRRAERGLDHLHRLAGHPQDLVHRLDRGRQAPRQARGRRRQAGDPGIGRPRARVIFDDVDADTVAKMAVAAKYRNAGQVCISPTRFYVQENVHDRFVANSPSSPRRCPSATGSTPRARWGRSPMPAASTRWSR